MVEMFPTGHVVFSSAPRDFLRVVLPFVEAALTGEPTASSANP